MGFGALSVWIAFLMGPSAALFGRPQPPAAAARSARSGPVSFIAPPQETNGSIKLLRSCHALRPDNFVVPDPDSFGVSPPAPPRGPAWHPSCDTEAGDRE